MMYRRTDEDEDESGSDWDELTPRSGASQSFPPPNNTRAHTSSPAVPSVTVTTTEKEIAPARVSSIPVVLPSTTEQKVAPFRTTSIPAANTTSTSPRLSVNSLQLSVNTTAAAQGWSTNRSTDSVAGLDTVRPFRDEMTSIADVKTPQPPPPKTPPSAKSVYRVVEQDVAGAHVGGVVNEEGVGEVPMEPEGEREVRRGGRRCVENIEYRADLEFATVTGDKAEYLSPSTQPPQAYMSEVADKWEGHAQRWVQECCSTLRLISDVIIAVLLGSTHCLLHHVVRKLCCGVGHILADSLGKPLAVLCFNGLFWPLVAGMVQMSKGLALILGPLLELVGVWMSWVVQVARACKPVLVNNKTYNGKQEHQV